MPGESSFKEGSWLDPSSPCSLGFDDCALCSASQYDHDSPAPEEWLISPWAGLPNTSTIARAPTDLSAPAFWAPDQDQQHCEILTDFKDESECIDQCRLMQATGTSRKELEVSSGGESSTDYCLNESDGELTPTDSHRTTREDDELSSSDDPADDWPASATTPSTTETIDRAPQAQCGWRNLQNFWWVRNSLTGMEVMVPDRVLSRMTTSTQVTKLLWAEGWRLDIKMPRKQAKAQARLGDFVGRVAKATVRSYQNVSFTAEQLDTDLRHLLSHDSILMTQFKLVKDHNPAWKDDEEPS